MEKVLNVFRVLLKIFVSLVNLCVFMMAVIYWIDRKNYASLPLIIASTLSYYCVIKDHSEDFWKRKFDEPLIKNLSMITIYLAMLLVIMFGIVIAARFN